MPSGACLSRRFSRPPCASRSPAPLLTIFPLAAWLASIPLPSCAASSTLPPVVVKGEQSPLLTVPVTGGSSLNLTPMQTPASVEGINRRQLEERGDATINDAVAQATGISATPHPANGMSDLSARGFDGASSVMQLYDGLRQYGGSSISFPFDTWSVERIEVLRGPASVTRGEGGIGGVINVVPKKPTQGPIRNEVQATLGTKNTQRLGLGSGGALSDRLSYRLDVSGNHSDGWVDRGNSRDSTFSGALQYQATPDLSLKLSHAYGSRRPMRYFGTPLIDGRQLDALRERNYDVQDTFVRFHDRWTELAATWTPGDALKVRSRLYHTASHRDWRNADNYDYNPDTGLVDRTRATQIRQDQKQTGLTTDATLKGQLAGLDNTLSAGFDVNHGSFHHTNNNYTGNPGSVDVFNPEPGYFQSDIPFIPRWRSTVDQYALFVEDRLVPSPGWSVVGGLHYDHARVRRDDLISGQRQFSRTYHDTGWHLGAVREVTPDLSLYAQYSKAAEPVSGLMWLRPGSENFDMTRGRQIEIGLKQAFWNGRGEWTLAAYHLRKTHMLTQDPLDPERSVQVGKRSARGIEGTLALNVARNWRVEANATVLRARFDDFTEQDDDGVTVSRNGKVPPNVPERLANLWVSWNFQPRWTAMAGLRHVAKRYANNADTLTLPAYTTADLALRWAMNPDTDLTARVYNVTDRAYFTTAYYHDTQWFYGPGRRFELTLSHRF